MHRALIPALVLAAAFTAPADAASFNCANAATPDEIAVCTHPDLSALDSEMGGLWFAYSQMPMLMGMSGNRQDEAHAFLQSRAACGGNVACLAGAYHTRIGALKQQLTQQIGETCTAQ